MSLIEYDDRVSVVDLKVLSDFLVDQIVIGHEYKVCSCNPIFGGIIWAVLMLDSLLVNLFNIHRIPRHFNLTLISVLVKLARVYSLLCCSARRVKREPFVHVYL